MPKMKLLIAEPHGFSETALNLLTDAGHTLMLCDLADRKALLARVAWAEALWTRFRFQIDAEVFQAAPNLRYVLCAATGTDHIDGRLAKVQGVRILSLADCGDLSSIRATAELTLGLILALTRRIPAAASAAANGEADRYSFKGHDLAGKNALVVGYGRVGKQVTKLLDAFGVTVKIWDIDTRYPVGGASLMELLPWADIVTVHVSLNDTSRNMFGAEQFAAMKPGTLFVNTSRGEVMDEAALQQALNPRANRLRAALDVLRHDDESYSAVLESVAREYQDRLILTPHIGGCTHEAMEAAEIMLAKRFLRKFEALVQDFDLIIEPNPRQYTDFDL